MTSDFDAAETALRFEILGPLRVSAASRQVAIRSGRERTLLATLLLYYGDTVPTDRLVEAIWNGQAPADARNQLQGCVSRLRKLLAGPDHQRSRIVTDPSGYRFLVEPSELDLWEFRRLRDGARGSKEVAGAEASRRYREALGLWRGSALADMDSELLRPTAAALDEERLQLLEECIQVELELGQGGVLVGELSELTARYPYREGLHGALMLALYRAGRQADALAAYRHTRQRLRKELGTEPTRRLQQLHQAILNHEPSLGCPDRQDGAVRGAPPPRELPRAIAAFTGRRGVLEALERQLADDQPRDGSPVPILVVTGTAGVGKTALAVHWAHAVADRFPDGQIHLNLLGHSAAAPLSPSEALSALLRSLGVPPEQIPIDQAEAAARYRSLLAGKRVLILLDDADTVEQIRPLLPGSPGCVVLVTSRNRLGGLIARDGAEPIGLDVFTEDEARSLLAGLLGIERVRAELAAAEALAAACAHLPLAMRIAAATLLAHPHQTIESYVAELTSGDRLAALQAEDDQESAVQAALARSYRAIPAPAQQLYRLLGLVPGPDFTPAAAAALAGTSVDVAADTLDRLARSHLVGEHAAGRYTFHDLLRLYAIQLCQTGDSAHERTAAVERLLESYLLTADAAAQRLHPQMLRLPLPHPDTVEATRFERPAKALAWFDAERANLVAAIGYASGNQPWRYAGLLADRLRGYFWHGRHSSDWQSTSRAALAAAERDGGPRMRAAAQFNVGHLHVCLGDNQGALAHFTSAGEWAARAGWHECQVATLGNIGTIYHTLGQLERAADHHAHLLRLNDERQEPGWRALNQVNLGLVERERGRLREATDHLRRAVEWNREHEYRHGEAAACAALGRTYLDLGKLDHAEPAITRALSQYRETGDRGGEAVAIHALADVYRAAGRIDDAVEVATRSAALAAEIGDSRCQADAINALGRAELSSGDTVRAIEHHRRALELARRNGFRYSETVSLIDLATAQTYAGGWIAAAELAQQAFDRAREAGYRVIEGRVLALLSVIRLHEQDLPAALGFADQAVDYYRSSGSRLGEAQALTVLGQVQHATGDPTAAQRSWQAARERYQTAGAMVPAELVDHPAQPACSGQTQACTQRQPSGRRS